MRLYTTVDDGDIVATVFDYSSAYPQRKADAVAEVTYGELRSGHVKIRNKKVPTASLSSYPRAVEVATILKDWIQKGEFLLTSPVASLPGADSGLVFKSLNERPVEEENQ